MKAAFVIIAIFVGLMFSIAIFLNAQTLLGFARGLSSSLVLTADGGETWFALGETEKNEDFIRSNILTLSFNPQDPRIVYAGTSGNGLFKSIDGGANWFKVIDTNNALSNDSSVYDIAYGSTSITVDSGIQETIYVSAYQGGYGRILLSHDGGFTFKEIYTTAVPETGIFFIFADRGTQRLWASTGESILIFSSDYGETWQRKEEFSRAVPVEMIRSGNRLMVTTQDRGVFISYDDGETWVDQSEPLDDFRGADDIFDVAQDPVDSQKLYLATGHGLLVSDDFGASWREIPLTIPENELPVRNVAISPLARSTLFVAAGRNMYISTNSGSTWKVRHILVRGAVSVIAPHPSDPSYVLAGTYR